jgi:hypothetical protein
VEVVLMLIEVVEVELEVIDLLVLDLLHYKVML